MHRLKHFTQGVVYFMYDGKDTLTPFRYDDQSVFIANGVEVSEEMYWRLMQHNAAIEFKRNRIADSRELKASANKLMLIISALEKYDSGTKFCSESFNQVANFGYQCRVSEDTDWRLDA